MKSSTKMQDINNEPDISRLFIFKDKFPVEAKMKFRSTLFFRPT